MYVVYKDELKHHGIKGQKWGVRRYQNPDGTLTAEGRERYLSFRSEGIRAMQERMDREREQRLRDAGIEKRDGYHVMKKGSVSYRVANPGDKIDSRRKYVTASTKDVDLYLDSALEGWLGNKPGEPITTFKYKAKKKILKLRLQKK